MDLLFQPDAWISLVTLAALEIILGIDNIVVLSVITSSLEEHSARRAQRIGLGMALVFRIVLLFFISWMTRLTAPVFEVAGQDFSWRDLILIGGGLFLMIKATQEVHAEIEGTHWERKHAAKKGFAAAIIAPITWAIMYGSTSAPLKRPPAHSPIVTAGLKWPPEM